MDNIEILIEYQNYKYESRINERMMYYDFVFPEKEIIQYIDDIISIPCEKIVSMLISSTDEISISSSDIFQFSSFDDCTSRLCEIIRKNNNPGLNSLLMGKLLLDDGKIRKDGAYTKYGENHLKAAASLGLTRKYYDTYYLTCIGYVFDTLDDGKKEKLLLRMVLRNNLIRRIIRATNNGSLDMRQFCYMLSDSTYIRRRSNLKKIVNILRDTEEYDFNVFLDKIIW